MDLYTRTAIHSKSYFYPYLKTLEEESMSGWNLRFYTLTKKLKELKSMSSYKISKLRDFWKQIEVQVMLGFDGALQFLENFSCFWVFNVFKYC